MDRFNAREHVESAIAENREENKKRPFQQSDEDFIKSQIAFLIEGDYFTYCHRNESNERSLLKEFCIRLAQIL